MQSLAAIAKASPVVPFRVKDDSPITQTITRTVDAVKQLQVSDAASYAQAGEDLLALKALERQVHEQYDDDKAAAFKLHKSLSSKCTAALSAIADGAAWLTGQRTRWKDQQEAVRREAERQAQIEAQAAQQQQLEAEAAALEREGHRDLAAATLEAALTAPAPPVHLPSPVPETQGIAEVTRWSYEVLNLGLVPREYLELDAKKVQGVVTALKGTTRIPGIRVFEVKTERVRL